MDPKYRGIVMRTHAKRTSSLWKRPYELFCLGQVVNDQRVGQEGSSRTQDGQRLAREGGEQHAADCGGHDP